MQIIETSSLFGPLVITRPRYSAWSMKMTNMAQKDITEFEVASLRPLPEIYTLALR